MRKKAISILLFLASATQVLAAGNLSGVYVTNQQNLTGSMKIQQLGDKKFKFEINTEKHGSGPYASSITSCFADGTAEILTHNLARYRSPKDNGELVIDFAIQQKNITVSSNADEMGMCGMGAWLDGKYKKMKK